MASISISSSRGLAGVKQTDYVVGTLATNAGDFEVRVNVLDGASHAVKRIDLLNFLDAVKRQVEAGKLGAFTTNILAP